MEHEWISDEFERVIHTDFLQLLLKMLNRLEKRKSADCIAVNFAIQLKRIAYINIKAICEHSPQDHEPLLNKPIFFIRLVLTTV